jgi:hypothetical protein
MKIQNQILSLLMLIGALAFVGCESDEGTGPAFPTDVEGYIQQGWAQYDADATTDAINSFQLAVNMADADLLTAMDDSIVAAAASDSVALAIAIADMNTARVQIVAITSGMGWTSVKDPQFASVGALTFDAGIALAEDLEMMSVADSVEVLRLHAELLAGYACLDQLLQLWQQSNERIADLLALDPEWDFDHDSGTDYLDLSLMSAENYYFLADFPASLSVALELNDILNHDPQLSEEDFNLATIEGRTLLMALIEELDDLI